MNIEVHNEKPINISFERKSSNPIIHVEGKKDVNANLLSEDVQVHVHKHPELKMFFETNVVSGASVVVLSQTEYDNLTPDVKTTYLVVEGGELMRFYIGSFLIAQKDENGFFPYNFPIIF